MFFSSIIFFTFHTFGGDAQFIHHFGLAHLANDTNEAASREVTRRRSNGESFRDILTKCAHTPPHRDWCGYWQGNPRRPERLGA